VTRRILLACALLILLAEAGAFAQSSGIPTTEPLLRIGIDTHTSFIEHMDTDSDGRYILTVSGDKTARLWDAVDGMLLRIFRPPIDHGSEGMLYACALSPDGKVAAVAGYTGFSWSRSGSIYLFDTDTGVMMRNLSGFPYSIHDMEFSINGRFLAVALWKEGVRIVDTKSWEIRHSLRGYSDICRSLSFDRTGRLVTVCYDGMVRLYDASFSLVDTKRIKGAKWPHCVAFSTDGGKIAVGFHESNRIVVLSGNGLEILYEPTTRGAGNTSHFAMCWSRDGETLYAGGWYSRRRGDTWLYSIEKFVPGGGGALYPVGTDTIFDIKMMPDGGLIYCTGTPELGRLDSEGQTVFHFRGGCNGYNSQNDHLRINRDGSEICFNPSGEQPVTFNVDACRLRNGLITAPLGIDAAGEITITNWRGSRAPMLARKGSASRAFTFMDPRERCHSVDISSSGRAILLGADWSVYRLDDRGTLAWKIRANTAWAVNISGDDRVFAAAYNDGTIRWHRFSDGELLLTLFLHRDGKRWVIWTPNGYFAASEGGETLAGWHFNNGAERPALFYFLSRFASKFERPDVIKRVLEFQSVEKAVAEANRRRRTPSADADLTAFLPPVVSILNPKNKARIDSERLELELLISTVPGNPSAGVRVSVDGRQTQDVGENRLPIEKPGQERRDLSIALENGEHVVEIEAENRAGWGDPAEVRIVRELRPQPRRTLRVAAAGMSGPFVWADASRQAARDATAKAEMLAEALAEALTFPLKQQGQDMYEQVSVDLLTGDRASSVAVRGALQRLSGPSSENTVHVLYLAAPVLRAADGRLYLLATDSNLEALERTALPLAEVVQALRDSNARTVVLIDNRPPAAPSASGGLGKAAIAGSEEIIRVFRDMQSKTVVWCTTQAGSTGGSSDSQGYDALGRAIVAGLDGSADFTRNGEISLNELEIYVRNIWNPNGRNAQELLIHKPLTVRDFPLAAVPQ